jgi:beta-glucosidase/6-phospho-beta-glucosidase/beta-galactosidase
MNEGTLNQDQQDQLLFMMLIQQHQQIGMMGLGKLKNPATDSIEKDLASAKYAIDTLTVIDKYTDGNLSKELKGFLDQILTTLRLNYADEAAKEGGSAPEDSEASADADG